MRGQFITFEGLDGSGKSTHLERVSGWLESRGVPIVVTREPGGTPLGKAIREVFLDPKWGEVDGTVETLMIFASRRQHLVEVIEPALEAGNHVLCDRFTDSTYAYQGCGRGVDPEIIHRVDKLATGARRPDRTLLFDLPAGVAQGRGQSTKRAESNSIDRLDSETLEFYRRVRTGYQELAEREPERFRIVDSTVDIETTANQVKEALADLVSGAE